MVALCSADKHQVGVVGLRAATWTTGWPLIFNIKLEEKIVKDTLKLCVAMIVFMVISLFASAVFALTDITPPVGGGFYEGKLTQPQSDSATGTTATTAYTPRFTGDWLLGKTGGSNAVWVARGLTTNDWSLVDGNGGDLGADDLAADSVGASELIEGEVYTVAGLTTTGAIDIAEGMIKDSMIVSADIKNDVIVNADIKSDAAIVATKIAGTAVTYSTAAQVSGDTTTDTTTNTPAFIGQSLVGGAGSGTSAVWIAKGTTTNDWVKVAP